MFCLFIYYPYEVYDIQYCIKLAMKFKFLTASIFLSYYCLWTQRYGQNIADTCFKKQNDYLPYVGLEIITS